MEISALGCFLRLFFFRVLFGGGDTDFEVEKKYGFFAHFFFSNKKLGDIFVFGSHGLFIWPQIKIGSVFDFKIENGGGGTPKDT